MKGSLGLVGCFDNVKTTFPTLSAYVKYWEVVGIGHLL